MSGLQNGRGESGKINGLEIKNKGLKHEGHEERQVEKWKIFLG